MKKKDIRIKKAAELRKRAETAVPGAAVSAEQVKAMSTEEIRELLHELEVYRVELEMQNEELIEAQAELDVSRTHFQDLYDLAPVGYCTVSEKGLILEINLTAAAMLGKPRADLANRPFSRFILREDQDVYCNQIKEIFETGEPRVREVRHAKSEGQPGWFSLRGLAVQETGGPPVCRLVISDITQRKLNEERIRESSCRLQAILDNSPILISEFDVEGRYQMVNRSICSTYGKPADEILGRSIEDLLSPETSDTLMRRIRHVQDSRECFTAEDNLEIYGSQRCFVTTLFPLFNVDRTVRSIGFLAHDITERKRAETGLKATLERLRGVTGSVIQVLVSAVEARDPYTAGHQKRTGDLARAIADEMRFPPEQVEGIRIAGVIHDLGKVSVSAELLSLPRKLSVTETAIIREHPRLGFEILKNVDFDWPVAEIVYQHHERLDGSGYPRGLKGEEILPEARILAVADVVEAMASHRPYRMALGIDAALEEIEQNRGTLYDAKAVDACLRLFREKGYQLVEIGR